MAFFNVDTDSLAAKSSQVQGTIGRLQAEVNSMQAGLRELEGLWTGQAATNFQQLILQWRATQQQVEESLTINRVVADLLDERSPKACEQAGKFIRIAYTPLIGDDAGFFAGPDASKCGLGEN